MKSKIVAGQVFGKLTTLKPGPKYIGSSDTRTRWICECECGVVETIISRYLERGDKKSCATCSVQSRKLTDLQYLKLEVKDLKRRIDNLENNQTKEEE